MPAEESKPVDPAVEQADATIKAKAAEVESDASSDEEAPAESTSAAGASGEAAKKKKKKSKRKKAKELLTGKSSDPQDEMSKAISNLNPHQLKEILALNPALAQEVAAASGTSNPSAEQTAQMLKKLNLQELMTGLASGGKNAKDMASYKFWQTQPVPRFDDKEEEMVEGPLKVQTVEDVSKEPAALVPGFEWVTVDLHDDEEVKEVYELLNGHYVEDDDAQFRFNYSPSLLRWAMMSPGWQKRYHIGVRATQSRKLVAFISAIPVHLRVRTNTVLCSEVNFLCVHKKLRGKRLAPVLIKEVTRISNLDQVWQGLYTAGVVLPRPVSTCRYYHRSLNWQKLYECGFSPLPPNSKPQYQVRKYALPDQTSTKGLRIMKEEDVDEVLALLKKYMARFDIAPEFTREEAVHWFLPKIESGGEQVVWSYVVEDADKKITDFFSFYSVESSVINNPKHSVVRVAYLFYYATTEGLDPNPPAASSTKKSQEPYNPPALKTRLNSLMNDALILAKLAKFDVFNALTLMDNALFLEQQKFGAGDGQLHYYLFNYRANSIRGGVTRDMKLDDKGLSGVGLIML